MREGERNATVLHSWLESMRQRESCSRVEQTKRAVARLPFHLKTIHRLNNLRADLFDSRYSTAVGGDLSARALASWMMWRRVVVEVDRETWVCEEETSIFFFKKFLDKKPDNYL